MEDILSWALQPGNGCVSLSETTVMNRSNATSKIFAKIRLDPEKISKIVASKPFTMVREKVKPAEHDRNQVTDVNQLILFNDDVNSFDFVIETLVEVCRHDPLQAEQCAWIAHHNGKCPVKEGSFAELTPFHDEMCNRGLTVTITK